MTQFFSQLFGGGGKKRETSPYAGGMPLPQTPSVGDSAGKAEAAARAKRRKTTETVFTSPLGVGGEAKIARKTLLGQ